MSKITRNIQITINQSYNNCLWRDGEGYSSCDFYDGMCFLYQCELLNYERCDKCIEEFGSDADTTFFEVVETN